MMKRLTSSETVEASGVTYRQLDYWVTKKHFVSELPTAGLGSGSLRYFSYNDAFRLRVVKTLIDRGVAVDVAQETSNHFDATMQGSWYLIIEEGEIQVISATDFQGDVGVLVCLPKIKETFDKKLAEIEKQQPLTLFRETINIDN